MSRKSFTARFLETVKPAETRQQFSDASRTGFVLRVSPEGKKYFGFRYQPKGAPAARFLAIGEYPAMSLKEASGKWQEHRREFTEGGDPHHDTPANGSQGSSVAACLDAFDRLHILVELRPSTQAQWKAPLAAFRAAFGPRPIKSIQRPDVTGFCDQPEKTTARDLRKKAVGRFFKFCLTKGWIDQNIATALGRSEAIERERTLTDQEVRVIWSKGNVHHRLLLLTGCRSAEISELRWSEISDDCTTITLPGERTKNGHAFTLLLSRQAQAIIRSLPRTGTFALTGGERPFVPDRDKLGITKDWVLHDLRRTCGTGMGDCGVTLDTIHRCLNHRMDKLGRIYDRSKREAEMRKAWQLWADRVQRVTTDLKVAA